MSRHCWSLMSQQASSYCACVRCLEHEDAVCCWRANLHQWGQRTACRRGERFLSSKTAHKSTSEQAERERGHCASVRQFRRRWLLQTLIFRPFGHPKPEFSRLSGQPTMDYFRFGQPTFRIIFVRRLGGSTGNTYDTSATIFYLLTELGLRDQ